MGKIGRIRAATTIIRELRRSEPRYSFEHVVANVLLGLAGFMLILLGEHRLWLTLFVVLLVSLAVQGFWVWRYTRKWNREYEERLRQAMQEDANA